MADKKKKSRWEEDTTVLISRDARAKLKMKALKAGKDLKKFLQDFANSK